MKHLLLLVALCLLAPGSRAADAPAHGAGLTLPFAGACTLGDVGGRLLYDGTCAIRRSPIPAGAAAGCMGERISLQIPGRGGGEVLRGSEPGCASRFLGSPVAFVATDNQGRIVVATPAGKVLRVDPGPDPALPVLDDFLAGMDECRPSRAADAFFQSLAAHFSLAPDAPEGPVAGRGPPVIWPPEGGVLAPDQISARKVGTELHVDLHLRGSYLGLPLVRLHYEYPVQGGWFLEQRLVFAAPRAEVLARFDAAHDSTARPPQRATADAAEVAPEEPGTLVCLFTR